MIRALFGLDNYSKLHLIISQIHTRCHLVLQNTVMSTGTSISVGNA